MYILASQLFYCYYNRPSKSYAFGTTTRYGISNTIVLETINKSVTVSTISDN